MPDNFLNDENVQELVRNTIVRIEYMIYINRDFQSAYNKFHGLIQQEMSDKLPEIQQNRNKKAKSFYKP